MKKYLVLGAMAVLALTGCDDKLNVAPFQSIDQAKALSTEKDVQVTLIGAYDGMQAATTYGGDMMVLSELIGNQDDIIFTGTFAGLSDVYFLEMVAPNGNAAGTWNQAYNVINRTNNVLAGVDKVTSSAANKNRTEGEALFIRASMYFELVRMYGKAWDDGNNSTNLGVPLVLQPTTSVTEADFRARNTVAEVYAQVIADLEKAESLLPVSNGIFATKNAAAAQLSRVFLMQGATGSSAAQLAALQKARDAADRVIQSNRHPLTTTFPALWFTFLTNAGNSPAEYIFSMKVTTQDGTNALNTYFGTNAGPGTAGRSDCKITPSHLDTYETGDVRKNYYVVVGGRNYTRKHLDRFGNVPIVRSAEMYLTRAETNLRLGTSVGDTPLNDVNRIRTRSGLDELDDAPTVADVVKERYLELAHEGSRIHDIKRTRGSVSLGTVQWNDPRLVFPIPEREMDTNPNLVQNTGYGN